VNLPNLITLARLLAVPVIVWLILKNQLIAAFWLFVAAGVSDAVDGFIAKRFNLETTFGKYLDPITDKVLLVSVYVSLGNEGHLYVWLVILVVFRDLVIVGGAMVYEQVTRSLTMTPLKISKVNTAAQIVLAAVVLGVRGAGLGYDMLIDALVAVVAVTSVVSGGAYVIKWSQRAAAAEDRS